MILQPVGFAKAAPWYLAGGLIDVEDVVCAYDLTHPTDYASDLIGSADLSAVGTPSHDGTKLTTTASSGLVATVATSLVYGTPKTFFLHAKGIASTNSGVLSVSNTANDSGFIILRINGTDAGIDARTSSLSSVSPCNTGASVFDASNDVDEHTGAFIQPDGTPANWSLYLDGSDTLASNSGSTDGHFACGITKIGIGVLVRTGNTFYPGDYWHAAIYDTALSAAQVAALHDAVM